MGTPAFMPPEQARGLWDEVDAQSDLWACGALMFTLLTGRQVHEARTSNEQLLSAMTHSAPVLASILPDVGAAVAHVVDRALAFDKPKRWSDARRMQEAVRRAYHDRNHAPITTAPRLTVPETVPDRTLPSTKGPIAARLPTTGRPVVETLMQLATLIHWTRPSRRVLGVASAVVVGLVVTIVSFAARNHRGASTPPTKPVASWVPSASAPVVPAAVVEAVPERPVAPVVAATDLPAMSPEPPPKQALTVKPPLVTPAVGPARQTPPTPAPTATCTPPFVLDSTGKKHWKAQCL